MAISIDLPIEHLREPMVSCDTALPCLLRAGVGKREDPEFEEFRRRAVLDGNTLPASRLIELVGKFRLQAECMRLDWNGLTGADLSHPILVFLKNTNVVVVTGTEGPGAEAVSVWDPLHSDSEALTVRREDFERAWNGDALAITPLSSTVAVVTSGSSGEPDIEAVDLPPETGGECALIAETELPPDPMPVAGRTKSRRLVAVGILAVAALIVPFWLYAVTGNIGNTRTLSKAESSGVPQTTAEPAVRSLMPAVSTSAATGPMPAAAPSVATPTPPESPGGRTAAVRPTTAALMPESASAAASPAPVAAANPPTGPTPIVPTPALSDSPGGPAAAVASVPAALARTSAPALTSPAPAEPAAGPAVAAGTVAAIPSTDVAAAPRPTGSPSSTESRPPGPEIAALVARGDVLFSTGDLAAARTFYERAADAGEAQAALRLGESYDPIFLEHAHLRGVRGNVETARSWYRRARDLGAAEAEVLLNSLQAQ